MKLATARPTTDPDDAPTRNTPNVKSVPLRSPFRFPGGKTWLVPHIRRWLSVMDREPSCFFEPFAGGSIVALTVAAESLARHVTMVELDKDISAVWRTVLGPNAEWLANRIARFHLTPQSLRRTLGTKPTCLREIAFQTILKNRTFHGGIVAKTSSPLRNGERGRGILSRWYPETLRGRIISIAEMKDRISFIQGDGMEIIRRNVRNPNAAFFLDPPYTVAGKKAGSRLYTHSEIDHQELFKIASKVAGDFLMTYDDSPSIRALAERHKLDVEPVIMRNTHHAEMVELLIGRDLAWARRRGARVA